MLWWDFESGCDSLWKSKGHKVHEEASPKAGGTQSEQGRPDWGQHSGCVVGTQAVGVGT